MTFTTGVYHKALDERQEFSEQLRKFTGNVQKRCQS